MANFTHTKLFKGITWVVLGAGICVLLISAMGKKSNKTCSDVRINIVDTKGKLFIDEADILQIMNQEIGRSPKGAPIEQFNLKKIEAKLQQDVWVKKAQLFFDNNNVLHVQLDERMPVARVFTKSGASFYIDSNCVRLPLSDAERANVPVFTGFTDVLKQLSVPDSLLLAQIGNMGAYISQQPFWLAQIAQVDITGNRFEMYPVVGNHIIEFGDGYNVASKLNRLYTFYKNVMSKTGMHKYHRVSVAFDRQVVAVKRDSLATRPDPAKAIKLFNEMLAKNQAEQAAEMAGILANVTKPEEAQTVIASAASLPETGDLPAEEAETKPAPVPRKKTTENNIQQTVPKQVTTVKTTESTKRPPAAKPAPAREKAGKTIAKAPPVKQDTKSSIQPKTTPRPNPDKEPAQVPKALMPKKG